MATALPAPLKTGDIPRYAARAKQLEQFRPVIAYWCNYYIVNQILNKGLHTESDECMTYTTTLMDKLETFKNENVGNDTVHDDAAAQAYVEQFALETFQRADNSVRANKATAQTAEAFQAAAAFLDLLAIWQTPLEKEAATKSKYAKFHALRIAKALRSGEDPNLSNPAIEQPPTPAALDPNDPEVQKIIGLQPSVEDGSEHSRPPSFVDRPPSTTRSPGIQTQNIHPPHREVSPLDPSPNGEYFPPTFTSEISAPSLPTAPSASADVEMTSPGTTTAAPLSPPPQNFYNVQTPPTQPSAPPHPQSQPPTFTSAPSFQAPAPQFIPAPQQPTYQAPTPTYQPPVPQQPIQPQLMPGQYIDTDEAVLAAQKHAKWAISALNFEDVPTAVAELRIALRALGAS